MTQLLLSRIVIYSIPTSGSFVFFLSAPLHWPLQGQGQHHVSLRLITVKCVKNQAEENCVSEQTCNLIALTGVAVATVTPVVTGLAVNVPLLTGTAGSFTLPLAVIGVIKLAAAASISGVDVFGPIFQLAGLGKGLLPGRLAKFAASDLYSRQWKVATCFPQLFTFLELIQDLRADGP